MITRYLPHRFGAWLYDLLYVRKEYRDNDINHRLMLEAKTRTDHLYDRVKALESVIAKMHGAEKELKITFETDPNC